MTKKSLPSLAYLQPRLNYSRALSLLSFGSLIVLISLWDIIWANLHGARRSIILAVELIPLLLLAPGLLLGSARTHAWTCFVMMLYFIKGVLACLDPQRYWLGALEVLLSVSLFSCALLYTRWHFQWQRKSQGDLT